MKVVANISEQEQEERVLNLKVRETMIPLLKPYCAGPGVDGAVEVRPFQGCTAFATRDFKSGEAVISEPALLQYS